MPNFEVSVLDAKMAPLLTELESLLHLCTMSNSVFKSEALPRLEKLRNNINTLTVTSEAQQLEFNRMFSILVDLFCNYKGSTYYI